MLANGVRLSLTRHSGGLAHSVSYSVTQNLTVPYGISTQLYFYVFTDVANKNRLKESSTSSATPIAVSPGQLPDIVVSFVDSNLETRGGQPYSIRFNVSNLGEGELKGKWFASLLLSRDVLVDPFDLKLGSVEFQPKLSRNDTVTKSLKVFIPYDIVSNQYYFILIADSRNDVYEVDGGNNQAVALVKVQETTSTDLAVVSVVTPSGQFQYGTGTI